MKRKRPKVKVNRENRHCTVGIEYSDLQTLLTLATNRLNEIHAEGRWDKSDLSKNWHKRMNYIIGALGDDARKQMYPKPPETRPMKEILKARLKERRIIDQILADALAAPAPLHAPIDRIGGPYDYSYGM